MSKSKMPARIWADLNSPALSRSQDQAGGFDSAMPYYRADIVEAMFEELLSCQRAVERIYPNGVFARSIRAALNSYREATNDKA